MTINCKGRLIDLKKPKVMGILNVTPDSFYDGGKYKDEVAILKQAKKILDEGASLSIFFENKSRHLVLMSSYCSEVCGM